MVVWNLTDVATPALKRRGVVNTPVVLGRVIIAPGASVELPEDVSASPHFAQQLSVYQQQGMLSKGLPPPAYLRAKARR